MHQGTSKITHRHIPLRHKTQEEPRIGMFKSANHARTHTTGLGAKIWRETVTTMLNIVTTMSNIVTTMSAIGTAVLNIVTTMSQC